MRFLGFEFKRSAEPVKHKRSFDAAKVNRLTRSWLGTANTIDMELRTDLDRLRARSRDMANNNDYIRRFLRMVERNVAGHSGFILQARSNDFGKPDSLANAAIEKAFYLWARKGSCEVSGKLGFADVQRNLCKAIARDGEALVRKVRGTQSGNDYGFALQLLDVSRLATMVNRNPTNGQNAIIMGVEINEFHRPIAYHLHEQAPGGSQGQGKILRIPADDIVHLYLPEHAEQTRGIPWAHSAMLRLHNLKGYEEAAVIASRVGAAKMGFFTTPDGSPAGLADGQDDAGEFMADAEAGTFGVLPQGYQFQSFNPDYPQNQYGAFVKSCLRGIASGMDISYNSLANDLEGVNYSSLRSGALEERDQWMTVQNWFAEAFLTPLFEEWLKLALLNQKVVMPNGSAIPLAKFDKFREHIWQGRRWAWVDPMKDIEAARLAVQSGVSSPQQIAAQMGMDIEDVLDSISAFEQMVKDKNVSVVSYASGNQQQPTKSDAPDVTALP
ncbi:phage portal protein [bacterium (Candidatus Blackallbacteria) CG18_big_fil_WC_8_21_14_2_50_49_26]|nr:MAG: phage portal protein [bacterium (Candidatus Blackallbacteria) CG18_big_fil_WC_8_21_14_2_50_49_26]